MREYTELVKLTKFEKKRDTAFSYTCNACSKCCFAKVIRVGPYEALRLSRQLGISTGQFLREYTEAGGTVLRTREDTSCIFLGEKGCTVHPDRPLACRVYPLSYQLDEDGKESFAVLQGEPDSLGVFGTQATVDDYCQQQGMPPFVAMTKRYAAVHDQMLAALGAAESDAAGRAAVHEEREMVDKVADGEVASPWLDVDTVVRAHCAKHDIAVPEAVDEIIALHLAALLELTA